MSAEQGNVEPWRENVERVREALVGAYPEINSAFREVHVDGMQALDALTTQIEELEESVKTIIREDGVVVSRQRAQIEELERERDEARATMFERESLRHEYLARAEKAERALAETIEHLRSAASTTPLVSLPWILKELDRAALRPSEDTSDES